MWTAPPFEEFTAPAVNVKVRKKKILKNQPLCCTWGKSIKPFDHLWLKSGKFWLLQIQFSILKIFFFRWGRVTLQTASSWLSPFPPSAPLRRSCCETASPRLARWPWAGENSGLLTPGSAQRTNTKEMWALLQSWRKSTGFLSIDGFILKARWIRSKVWGTQLIPLVSW